MKPKIEKRVPIPPPYGTTNYQILDKMKKGDSVLWESGSQAPLRHAMRLRFGKGGYTIRTTEEGVRVWRIK